MLIKYDCGVVNTKDFKSGLDSLIIYKDGYGNYNLVIDGGDDSKKLFVVARLFRSDNINECSRMRRLILEAYEAGQEEFEVRESLLYSNIKNKGDMVEVRDKLVNIIKCMCVTKDKEELREYYKQARCMLSDIHHFKCDSLEKES